jgi:hypothetical protein
MIIREDFWSALSQLAATMASEEEYITHQENLQAIVVAFATAPAERKREMRLALWAVLTFLEELSTLVPQSQ